ncbi:phage tail tube assembly chaperone [Leuconostoc suionicum]|uniref:phage tail tube assembly chaperone n=1 Tax=Leuconostoc suionicum TaxID=1511761 RepID=UPI00233E7B11|nr:phage tail tube assembly chaperone [Leuconostoc suionicum]MDC2815780.1 phage tail tube assembly chaperone [Leuconostoc suionicum]
MAVKINVAKELGIKKTIEVEPTNKVVRDTWKFQRTQVKMSINQATRGDSEEAIEEMLDSMLATQDETISYVIDTLRLTSAQAKKIDDMTFNETVDLANKISAEILGIETVEATEEEVGLEA